MATTSSSSSRQPVPPAERPSRVSRTAKDTQRSSKRRGQPVQRGEHSHHHQRQLSRDEDVEEENEEEDDNGGLSRNEAALIDARFHRAVDIIQSFPKSGPITTTYEEKLMLYSLYKQGKLAITPKCSICG